MEDDLARQQHAERLLEDSLLTEAFDALEKELTMLWQQTASTDVDQRESFWLAIRLLDRVRVHLISIVDSGKMAQILNKHHPYI